MTSTSSEFRLCSVAARQRGLPQVACTFCFSLPLHHPQSSNCPFLTFLFLYCQHIRPISLASPSFSSHGSWSWSCTNNSPPPAAPTTRSLVPASGLAIGSASPWGASAPNVLPLLRCAPHGQTATTTASAAEWHLCLPCPLPHGPVSTPEGLWPLRRPLWWTAQRKLWAGALVK